MPTIIKLYPGVSSQIALHRYLARNNIESTRKSFHTTLRYSITPLFMRHEVEEIINSSLPRTISPQYNLKIFGTKLVLKYNNEEIDNLREELNKEALRQKIEEWPDGLSDSEKNLLKESICYVPQKNQNQDGSYNWKTYSGKIISIWPNSQTHITLASNFDKARLEEISKFKEEIIFEGWALKHKD